MKARIDCFLVNQTSKKAEFVEDFIDCGDPNIFKVGEIIYFDCFIDKDIYTNLHEYQGKKIKITDQKKSLTIRLDKPNILTVLYYFEFV